MLIAAWHPLRIAVEYAEMGNCKPGAMRGRSAHRIRNLPKSGPPCFFLLVPGFCKGSTGFGSWWQRKEAKKEPKMVITAYSTNKTVFFLFSCFPPLLCGGRAGGPLVENKRVHPRTLLVRDVHFKG